MDLHRQPIGGVDSLISSGEGPPGETRAPPGASAPAAISSARDFPPAARSRPRSSRRGGRPDPRTRRWGPAGRSCRQPPSAARPRPASCRPERTAAAAASCRGGHRPIPEEHHPDQVEPPRPAPPAAKADTNSVSMRAPAAGWRAAGLGLVGRRLLRLARPAAARARGRRPASRARAARAAPGGRAPPGPARRAGRAGGRRATGAGVGRAAGHRARRPVLLVHLAQVASLRGPRRAAGWSPPARRRRGAAALAADLLALDLRRRSSSPRSLTNTPCQRRSKAACSRETSSSGRTRSQSGERPTR